MTLNFSVMYPGYSSGSTPTRWGAPTRWEVPTSDADDFWQKRAKIKEFVLIGAGGVLAVTPPIATNAFHPQMETTIRLMCHLILESCFRIETYCQLVSLQNFLI